MVEITNENFIFCENRKLNKILLMEYYLMIS